MPVFGVITDLGDGVWFSLSRGSALVLVFCFLSGHWKSVIAVWCLVGNFCEPLCSLARSAAMFLSTDVGSWDNEMS